MIVIKKKKKGGRKGRMKGKHVPQPPTYQVEITRFLACFLSRQKIIK